jgi:hypothetical protein
MFDYVLPACARISKAMAAQFECYLPLIMEILLRGANQPTNFSMTDADADEVEGEVTIDEDTGNETTVVAIAAGMKKRVSMNTHAVQQKNQAARMLYDFAANMKGYLRNYLEACLQTLLTLSMDKHSSEIRSSSTLALAKIFEAYVDGVLQQHILPNQPAAQRQLLNDVMIACIGKLADCIRGESNATSRTCATEALRDILQACYLSGETTIECRHFNFLCLPDIQICSHVTSVVLQQCQETLTRRQAKVKDFERNEALDANEDRSVLDEALEDDDDLLTNLVDALGQLVKLQGEAYMPLCEQRIIPAFASFLTPEQPVKLQILAVCMLDDAIEFGGQAMMKYLPQIIPYFENNFFVEDKILRQCSVYGIAQITRVAPAVIVSYIPSILPKLFQLTQVSDANDDDNIGITENALFAIGSICTNPAYQHSITWGQHHLPNKEEAVGVWLRGLPLKSDEVEAKVAASQFCDLAEQEMAIFSKYFPEVIRVVAEVMLSQSANAQNKDDDASYSYAHPEVQHRMEAMLRGFAMNLPSEQVSAAFANLSAEQQRVIQSLQ